VGLNGEGAASRHPDSYFALLKELIRTQGRSPGLTVVVRDNDVTRRRVPDVLPVGAGCSTSTSCRSTRTTSCTHRRVLGARSTRSGDHPADTVVWRSRSGSPRPAGTRGRQSRPVASTQATYMARAQLHVPEPQRRPLLHVRFRTDGIDPAAQETTSAWCTTRPTLSASNPQGLRTSPMPRPPVSSAARRRRQGVPGARTDRPCTRQRRYAVPPIWAASIELDGDGHATGPVRSPVWYGLTARSPERERQIR